MQRSPHGRTCCCIGEPRFIRYQLARGLAVLRLHGGVIKPEILIEERGEMNIRSRKIEQRALGMTAALVGGVLGWLFPMVIQAANCGGFGTQAELSKYYEQAHKCGTCAGQDSHANYCAAVNRMMKFDPAGPGPDVVLIPHRGIWGGVGSAGAAENTMGALVASRNAGYRIVEIDAMLSEKTRPSPSAPYTGEQIKMSHYFDMFAYGGTDGANPRVTAGLSTYKMKKRNGAKSDDPHDRIASINEAIDFAVNNGLMLTVDPKVPDKSDQIDLDQNVPDANEYAAIVGAVLSAARAKNALGHITIKSTFTPWDLIDRMVDHHYLSGGYYVDYKGRFLWSPIINKSAAVSVEAMKAIVDQWYGGDRCFYSGYYDCVSAKEVMTIETQIYNDQHWTNKSIQHGSAIYANIIAFVQNYTKDKGAARRATLWSVDPMGHLGTLSRQYDWKFIGNNIVEAAANAAAEDDLRSNPVFLITRQRAARSAIITDRPDVYESMVNQ